MPDPQPDLTAARMIDLDDPAAVAAELRRRGLPVHTRDTHMRTDRDLLRLFGDARRGGWRAASGRPPKPREVNRGRLIGAMRD